MVNKAIFWDFDGTLVWANESFKYSLIDAFKECKYKIDKNDIGEFLKSVCSWYNPQKDYVDRTKEKWWEKLLNNVQNFCKKNHIKEEDIQLICKLFKKNIITFEYIISR